MNFAHAQNRRYKECRDVAIMLEEHPATWVRYSSQIIKTVKDAATMTATEKAKDQYRGKPLRTWQKDVVRAVLRQNDREITWIVDQEGGNGKTWLCRWIDVHHDAQVFENMKSSDFGHMYKGKQWVLFDFSRSTEDHINFGMIECAKNGWVQSGKYEGNTVWTPNPKVLVMSNHFPDESKLSHDRWDIWLLTNNVVTRMTPHDPQHDDITPMPSDDEEASGNEEMTVDPTPLITIQPIVTDPIENIAIARRIKKESYRIPWNNILLPIIISSDEED